MARNEYRVLWYQSQDEATPKFLPLIIFVIVFQMSGTTLNLGSWEYTFDGIYTATIALILATILQVLIVKLVWGSVEKRLLGLRAP